MHDKWSSTGINGMEMYSCPSPNVNELVMLMQIWAKAARKKIKKVEWCISLSELFCWHSCCLWTLRSIFKSTVGNNITAHLLVVYVYVPPLNVRNEGNLHLMQESLSTWELWGSSARQAEALWGRSRVNPLKPMSFDAVVKGSDFVLYAAPSPYSYLSTVPKMCREISRSHCWITGTSDYCIQSQRQQTPRMCDPFKRPSPPPTQPSGDIPKRSILALLEILRFTRWGWCICTI